MFHVITKNKVNRCSYYFALEEYLLKKGNQQEYFFLWKIDKSLVVGRNQLIFDELNLKNAHDDHILVYRRPSGGGAVYADENCLMFSFITPHFDTSMVFTTYLNKMVEALGRMNIPCTFSGRNDLLIEGKKFSGNAFYHIYQSACLHGTLLFATDLSVMGRYLTPNKLKLGSKGIDSVVSRVTNINQYYPYSIDTFATTLVDNLDLIPYRLSLEEESIIEQLQTKYEEEDYIYRKTPYNKKLSTYTKAGVIDFNFTLVNHQIKHCKISGDFFTNDDLSQIESLFIDQTFHKESILRILHHSLIKDFIYDYDEESLIKAIITYFE